MGTLIRDGVKIGGTTVYVDSNLSTTSENPVENKIVTSALNEKANTSSLANVATTGSYNDLSNKPEIDTNLSTESTNAVQNKVITNSLDEKYPIDYDVALSLAEWEALGEEKYYNHKNYYIYDAGTPTEKTTVYGWHVDPNESDPTAAVSYIKEAIGMTPASMGTTSFNYGSWKDAFFMPKPCMVKENGKVDYYLDENDYTKAKDVITITSTPDNELPLSFNSTNEDITLNYQVYGETVENLFDYTAKNTSKGYVSGSILLSDGTVTQANGFYVSEYIPISGSQIYTFYLKAGYETASLCFYDAFKNYADGEAYNFRTEIVTTSPSNAAYVRFSVREVIEADLMLTKGSTAPTRYVPYGTPDGVGEETENLVPFIDEWGNGYVSNSGAISSPAEDTQERYSPQIVIEPNATYQWAYQTGSFPQSSTKSAWSGIGWYNDDGFISRNSGTVNTTLEVVAPANAKYAILSFRSFGENYSTMFIKSSTAPTTFIPYGFKIPILNTSGIVSENEFPYAEAGTFALGTGSVVSDGKGSFSIDVSNLSANTYSDYIPLKQNYTIPQSRDTGGEYTFYLGNSGATLGLFIEFLDSDKIHIEEWQCATSWRKSTAYSDMAGSTIAYIRFYVRADFTIQMTMSPMFSKNSNLTSYVPHFQQSNYDLFIGDSKLYEDEYLEYAEQKMYKRTANLFDVTKEIVGEYLSTETGGLKHTVNSNTSDFINVAPFDYVTIVLELDGTLHSTAAREWCGYDQNKQYIGGGSGFGVYIVEGIQKVIVTIKVTGIYYIRFDYDKSHTNIMLVEGSTAPSSYIPYLQPTDPPVPFPTIQTYQGENTLSSTETLNSFSIYAMSDITNLNYNGNAMIEWPLIWWKYESGKVDGEGSFYVSNRKIDNTYNCWCNYDSKNNITNHFYTAAYTGIMYNNKLRSISGIPLYYEKTSTIYSTTQTTYSSSSTYAIDAVVRYEGLAYKCTTAVETPETFDPTKWTQIDVYAIDATVLYNDLMYKCITAVTQVEAFDSTKWEQVPYCGNTTGTQEVNGAIANNTTNDVEWYIDVWADRMLINGLLILMSKSLDSQSKFGWGIANGAKSGKTNYITGSLNDKGMFWGTQTNTQAVKVFGMENWWGCVWHRTAGVVGTSTGYKYKLTYNTADGSEATSYNSNGNGYLTLTTARPSVSDYAVKMIYGNHGYLTIDTTNGTASTYYCDNYTTGDEYLLVGGHSNHTSRVGISDFYFNGGFSAPHWGFDSYLTLKPLTIPPNP